MTSPNAWAYGRAAMTRSCARFIFDVATISMVRVILRVFSTDLMRPLSSRPLAIVLALAAEDLLEAVDRALQLGLGVLREGLLRAHALADLRELRADVVHEARLPRADLVDRDLVEVAVRHRVQDHHLLVDAHR